MEETIFAQTELEDKETIAKEVIALFDLLSTPCTTYGLPLPLSKIRQLISRRRRGRFTSLPTPLYPEPWFAVSSEWKDEESGRRRCGCETPKRCLSAMTSLKKSSGTGTLCVIDDSEGDSDGHVKRGFFHHLFHAVKEVVRALSGW